MPRLYVTPSELAEIPLGFALASQLSSMPAGTIDKLLARASQRCDAFCEKRLQAPASTTLAAVALPTATTISVISTLTLDNLAENAVILDAGLGNQEIVLIQPGGVTVTTWLSPYPGTLELASPLQFTHTVGASVKFVYMETTQAIKASMSDPYSEALQTQAAQLALAHLPPIHVGLTRIVFLKSYPVKAVYMIEHAYSFDTVYYTVYNSSNTVFANGIILEPTAGYYRFRVGTVITPEGMVRSTYTAGYDSVPEDIKEAVTYYLADAFQRLSNPYVATKMTQGKRVQEYAFKDGKTPAVQAAEAILKRYRRSV